MDIRLGLEAARVVSSVPAMIPNGSQNRERWYLKAIVWSQTNLLEDVVLIPVRGLIR